MFGYSHLISHLKVSIFFIFFIPNSIYMLGFTSTGFILMVLWYVLLYSLAISPNFHICWYRGHIFVNFVLQDSKKSFSNSRFSFFICWKHLYIIILKAWFHLPIVKFVTFIYPYFVWFGLDSSKTIWNALVVLIHTFFVFQSNNIFTINTNKTQ